MYDALKFALKRVYLILPQHHSRVSLCVEQHLIYILVGNWFLNKKINFVCTSNSVVISISLAWLMFELLFIFLQ